MTVEGQQRQLEQQKLDADNVVSVPEQQLQKRKKDKRTASQMGNGVTMNVGVAGITGVGSGGTGRAGGAGGGKLQRGGTAAMMDGTYFYRDVLSMKGKRRLLISARAHTRHRVVVVAAA